MKDSVLDTIDEFVAAIPWGENRAVLVYRRRHGGRTFVRVRIWNQHRDRKVWYPTKRAFVIPIQNVEDLAEAIRSAAGGKVGGKPDWLERREQAEQERVAYLEDLEAPMTVAGLAGQLLQSRVRGRV